MRNGQTKRQHKEMAVNHPMTHVAGPHPNEFDLRRIELLLEKRLRYRYVSPEVQPVSDGYLVVSPCCSRNIDASGGTIDIARIEYIYPEGMWRLYHKEHELSVWKLYLAAPSLQLLIVCLNEDSTRVFWQ